MMGFINGLHADGFYTTSLAGKRWLLGTISKALWSDKAHYENATVALRAASTDTMYRLGTTAL